MPPAGIALGIAAVNVLAFLAFALDKRLAVAGARRISESTLLLLALIGGTVGAIAAQHLLRHKTRKEPFRTTLYGIAVLQIIAISIWLVRPEIFAGLGRT